MSVPNFNLSTPFDSNSGDWDRVVLTSVAAAGDHLDGIVCERAKAEIRPREGELVVVGF